MNCISCDIITPELLDQVAQMKIKIAHLECDSKLLVQDRERIMGERDMAIKVARMLISLSDNPDKDRKAAVMILEQLEAKQKGQ
jgi:hypothetical protein